MYPCMSSSQFAMNYVSFLIVVSILDSVYTQRKVCCKKLTIDPLTALKIQQIKIPLKIVDSLMPKIELRVP